MLRQLELDSQREAHTLEASSALASTSCIPAGLHPSSFDISQYISLVPMFRETEEDS